MTPRTSFPIPLPDLEPGIAQSEPLEAQSNAEYAEQVAEIAALKLEVAEQLGHQCAECLTDALVARFLKGLSKYDLRIEIEEHLSAAERF